MPPQFKPPVNEEELRKRAEDITPAGAQAMIRALEGRKAAAVKPFDEEIKFYQDVIKLKEEEV